MKKIITLFSLAFFVTIKGFSFIQTVTVADHAFAPASFSIHVGDTINFVWVSGFHTTTSLTIPGGAATWDHPINSTSTNFSYVPSVIGNYNYKCTFHFAMGMVGSFTVICPSVNTQISAASTTTFCKGGSLSLNSSLTSGVTYKWKKNGAAISGATSSSYLAKATGNYNLKITNSCGSVYNSNTIAVTVHLLPDAIVTPTDTVYKCLADTIVLAANTGPSLTYKWSRSGNIISGATSSTVNAIKAGTYKVTVTNSSTGCTKASPVTRVIINCRTTPVESLQPSAIDIRLVPNPADQNISISFQSNDASAQVQISNLNGQIVKQLEINSNSGSYTKSMDISMLPKGMYTLLITTDKGSQGQKTFLKE